MLILTILEVLKFDFSKFESQIYQNSKFRLSKIATNDIFGPFEFTKIGFHVKSEWQPVKLSNFNKVKP